MTRFWKVLMVVILVLLLAQTIGRERRSAHADWVTGINASDYPGSGVGYIIYSDFLALKNVLNGAVTDTNISATANIDGSKLADSTLPLDKFVYGIPYFPSEDNDSSRVFAYGDANIISGAADSILAGASVDVVIAFSESSTVGNPAFSGIPQILYSINMYSMTPQGDSRPVANWNHDSLFVYPKGISATACTLGVENASGDTAWVKQLRISWQAME